MPRAAGITDVTAAGMSYVGARAVQQFPDASCIAALAIVQLALPRPSAKCQRRIFLRRQMTLDVEVAALSSAMIKRLLTRCGFPVICADVPCFIHPAE